MSIQIKIFLGFLENKEMKMHLRQSPLWSEEKIIGQFNLIEIHDQEKEYIGLFIAPLLSYEELKKKEQEIKSHLQLYCPKLNLDKQRSYLLSQLFIH